MSQLSNDSKELAMIMAAAAGIGIIGTVWMIAILFDWWSMKPAGTSRRPKLTEADSILKQWKERRITTSELPSVTNEAAMTLQANCQLEEAEKCLQLPRVALQYERLRLSDMQCREFVGKDGHGSDHLGTFNDTHYHLNSLRSRKDSRHGAAFDHKRQWRQVVQGLQRSRWRTAVYLLQMSRKKLDRQEQERKQWAQVQHANREKDRQARVDEVIANERRRWTQPRPRIHLQQRWGKW